VDYKGMKTRGDEEKRCGMELVWWKGWREIMLGTKGSAGMSGEERDGGRVGSRTHSCLCRPHSGAIPLRVAPGAAVQDIVEGGSKTFATPPYGPRTASRRHPCLIGNA
jgi:hypothetical protein